MIRNKEFLTFNISNEKKNNQLYKKKFVENIKLLIVCKIEMNINYINEYTKLQKSIQNTKLKTTHFFDAHSLHYFIYILSKN
ncbi:hypothetical protein PFAG_03866 [Plasmodium falciparum Santa Lucia]|uniref:Uncharacterized protein n=9 Tax=Plasmodium falciparum TaxID=5833 RepID=W7K2U8_PLAFO|nr:hypothetical protein PFFVO_03481 [Plasmodium falciparum Vietnam Oak-Knoll (FVO)]ETW35433.1 hypothetical protein PFTANZ_03852 [Plasmodium falciparum Tanzania (2000708)]ETW41617.1 hypothetical protein PFNF135_04027 [Plasmodium falciparum NF135/5.C10]ETW48199.1 hypothetical protein PFMALIP_03767 [Plasmodium falciparum MaliPS096_E11]ETW60252.1 hypothetical protein PFMC_03796 [Plasmodium falciparum CAMP/Malaysia]EUR68693.1 hypothetical protein PFBG_03924 [Plasmodium falciparum 7G8]EUT82490.1 hy